MSRIPALDPIATTGKTAENLAAVGKLLGVTPNLFRVAANSPAALDALIGLNGAAARGTLRASAREAISLAVSQANGCDYCLSAHTALGAGAGLPSAAIAAARHATADDPKLAALLRFANLLVVERGRAPESALAQVRAAGASDAEVLEVVTNVVLTIFTNYINLVADTDIDFPVVRAA
ncbi:MAG TPA: carboxymuconolactone decarboxylase family protein [Kofleriaceae bacterium]|nr:carboxymuconolactone decarboxylase family protein [Kofleriaceae bacterium]